MSHSSTVHLWTNFLLGSGPRIITKIQLALDIFLYHTMFCMSIVEYNQDFMYNISNIHVWGLDSLHIITITLDETYKQYFLEKK